MRWLIRPEPPDPAEGDTRMIFSFAWFPVVNVLSPSGADKYTIWMERYWEHQEYRVYHDGGCWETVQKELY